MQSGWMQHALLFLDQNGGRCDKREENEGKLIFLLKRKILESLNNNKCSLNYFNADFRYFCGK